jgi:hypothetical protein
MKKMFICAFVFACFVGMFTLAVDNGSIWETVDMVGIKGGSCYTFTWNSCPGKANATCTDTACTSTDGGTTWTCPSSSVQKQLTLGYLNYPHRVETGGFAYPSAPGTICSATVTCSSCQLDTETGKQMCTDGTSANDPPTPSCAYGDPC